MVSDAAIGAFESNISYPDEGPVWKASGWKADDLLTDAALVRIPMGCCKDVWAAAHNGNHNLKSRALALSLCLACAVLRPLARPLQQSSASSRVPCRDSPPVEG